MTSEERFIKIENTLAMVSEHLAQHKIAIRDLIVVSRTLLNSQIEMKESIESTKESVEREISAWRKAFDAEMAESRRAFDDRMAETDKRLNRLIEIVDEIMRRKKNGDA